MARGRATENARGIGGSVAVGSALAFHRGRFDVSLAALTLATAMLIQVGTNLVNDAYDFLRGADDERRLGPVRASQSGLIPHHRVRRAAILVLALAAACGVRLITVGGLPILIVGLASLLCAWAYTAGPWPLAYHGLGDLFVWVFFGPVAVAGTYYLQTATVDTTAWLASVPIGCLAAAILTVNNLRDIVGDAHAGKNTLAVRIGERATRFQYAALVATAFSVQGVLAATGGPVFAFALATSPLALNEVVALYRRDGAELNSSLAGTARLLIIYGLASVFGLSIGGPVTCA